MVCVVDDSMLMRILTGKKAGAARRAKWNGDKEIPEESAFLCNPVYVGRFGDGMSHTTQSIPTQIIDKDENDIGTVA